MAFIYHCLKNTTMLQKLSKVHLVDFRFFFSLKLPARQSVHHQTWWVIITCRNSPVIKKKNLKAQQCDLEIFLKNIIKNPLNGVPNFLQPEYFSWPLRGVFQHCSSSTENAKPSRIKTSLTNVWERGNQTDGYFHLPSWAACEKTNKQPSGSHSDSFWLLPFKGGCKAKWSSGSILAALVVCPACPSSQLA